MSDDILLRASNKEDIGMTFKLGMSEKEIMDRLLAAQHKINQARKRLLSDEFAFDGQEITGKRR